MTIPNAAKAEAGEVIHSITLLSGVVVSRLMGWRLYPEEDCVRAEMTIDRWYDEDEEEKVKAYHLWENISALTFAAEGVGHRAWDKQETRRSVTLG